MCKFIKGAVLFMFMLISAVSIKGYNSDDVFLFTVPKGATIYGMAQDLSIPIDTLVKYNPKLQNGLTAGMQLRLPASIVPEEKLKKIDAAPTIERGASNSVTSASSTDDRAMQKQQSSAVVDKTLADRIREGAQLYHYDKIEIEGESFWSLNNIKKGVTANQISEATGIPVEQLKLHSRLAAGLKVYDRAVNKDASKVMCQYYLSHPDMTIKELGEISRARYKGVNHLIRIYLAENPSKLKLNADGSVVVPAEVPSRIESVKTLKKFFSNSPRFKCNQTGVILTLSFDAANGFVAYIGDKRYGKFEVDTRKDEPRKALVGLPWLNGYGPAPMVLSLNGENTTLALLPVEGEENLSYNSRGNLQYGATGNKGWMQLSLSSDGVTFTPVDYRPDPERFRFIGFTEKKLSNDATIYTKNEVDQVASYPGGEIAMYKLMATVMQYPKEAAENDIQGRVLMRLLVEPDGNVSEITVVKSVHPALDKEAVSVAEMLGSFNPAKKNGAAVRSYIFLPITFAFH